MNNCSECGYSNKNNGNCMAVAGFHTAVPAANCKLLAEYENTGLTPDEVQQLIIFEMAKAVASITEFDGVPIQRLKELAAADKSGKIKLVRQAHWKKVGRGIMACSGCNHGIQEHMAYVNKFCPNCGAKMNGGTGDAGN